MNKIKPSATCVVLGSSTTALSVIRGLARLGIFSIVVDTRHGIATHSRYCVRSEVLSKGSLDASMHADALATLRDIAQDRADMPLIATSDEWLSFILDNRRALEHNYLIEHPESTALRLCLNKDEFYRWCADNGFRTPKTISDISPDQVARIENFLAFPILVKLSNKTKSTTPFPKTKEIGSKQEFLTFFENMKLQKITGDLLVSESLLQRNLEQFSVPFCCNGKDVIAFTAIKVRPGPKSCRVGTYVKLQHDAAVLAEAKRLVKRLGYIGIGEVEILRDADTGEDFVIEINARPWTQFGIQYVAGFDFLRFLMTSGSLAGPPCNEGKAWVSLVADFYTFKRDSHQGGHNSLRAWANYIKSLLYARSFCYFSVSDPRPFVFNSAQLIRAAAKKFSEK